MNVIGGQLAFYTSNYLSNVMVTFAIKTLHFIKRGLKKKSANRIICLQVVYVQLFAIVEVL